MELLLVRHARAEDRDVFARTGQPDAQRPLTEEGIARMREAAKGLRRILPDLAVVVSSPLRRAAQTADILADRYDLPPQRIDALAPGGDFAQLFDWIGRLDEGPVALVGHEPDLGYLASVLLAGDGADFVPLKKGACCLIDCPDGVRPGTGQLQWLLTTGHLRKLVKSK